MGIRAILGSELSVLAIKALLVHGATANGLPRTEVGWGKISEDLTDIITCGDGVARIVYQGELRPGKYLRASLPIPKNGLTGMVNLKATFCYSTPIDPSHTSSHTRSGLEVVFRPNGKNHEPGKANAQTRSFFKLGQYASEAERRSDSGKWEPVLHDEDRMRGSTLDDPVFDIHYIAREGAGPTGRARPIPYALVVTIEAPNHTELFSTVLADHRVLVAIEPEITLPVSV